ncbi:hypothetical protein L2E82_02247 [Cichorium intybus]|uniref:Uncharacterized protein n=1 Tax=Cichorium intybus TaxID=13427 RepID=A0ACB9H1M8_CICIN|nr:hypothetical protein L2E82_02247 [Cichorium intybus]
MSEKKELGGLWSSTERTCIYLLQYTSTTKGRLLQIHAFMLRNSLYNNNNILAKFIATCSSFAVQQFTISSEYATDLIQHARKLFDYMPDNDDTFICNTMMRAHLGIHQYDECLSLYKALKKRDDFKPDGYTYLTLAKLCTSSLDVWRSRQLHNHIVKEGFRHNLFVATSLVDMYAKLGHMDCAKKVFDEMPERSQVSWTALVGGYAKHGEIDNARMFFNQMPKKDTPAFNAMIDAYDSERAKRILRKSNGKEYWNDGNYITLRNLYAREKRWGDVEEMMRCKKSRKEVGCSVIEAGGKVWGFASGDRLHPEWGSISLMLDQLLVHMKKKKCI